MRKLYEIDKDIEEATELLYNSIEIDEETGEVISDTSLLDKLMEERAEKLEGVILAYKNKSAEFEAVYHEFEAFRERQQRLKKERDRLKAYIEYALQGETFQTDKVAVTYRRSEQAKTDEGFNNEDYGSYEFKVDRMALKKAIKSGIEVEGAWIEENKTMTIK